MIKISYERTAMPTGHNDYVPVLLNRETMDIHRVQVLQKMKEKNLDVLIIYADREHGANYAYLTGFEPRFEESLLILHKDGKCYLMLGNENMKMCQYSFIKAEAIHVPHFSLPYQPMENTKSLPELFGDAGIENGMQIGCAGWKLFSSRLDDNDHLIDIPSFIMEAVGKRNPDGSFCNVAGLFLDPLEGLRIHVNANEIAHYEFGAGAASSKVLEAINQVAPGKTEIEIAEKLNGFGQPVTVTTICAAGDRFTDAVVFPRNKKIRMGDKFSITLGLRGGLTSRAAYVAECQKDLPEDVRDYMEKLAIPYYRAAVSWYEKVGIGVSCAEIYQMVEEVLPKEDYHWSLNPGHFTGVEEWISSPVFKDSPVVLESGMMLQMDIIPSLAGYGGANAEDGIVIADQQLQMQLKREYPKTWERMQKRKRYMKEELGICLKDEILPLSDICGYMRPYLLNHNYALRKI